MNFIVAENTTKPDNVLGVIYVVCVAKKTEIILKKSERKDQSIQSRKEEHSWLTREGRGKI